MCLFVVSFSLSETHRVRSTCPCLEAEAARQVVSHATVLSKYRSVLSSVVFRRLLYACGMLSTLFLYPTLVSSRKDLQKEGGSKPRFMLKNIFFTLVHVLFWNEHHSFRFDNISCDFFQKKSQPQFSVSMSDTPASGEEKKRKIKKNARK
jgi:hypothetical protein